MMDCEDVALWILAFAGMNGAGGQTSYQDEYDG